MYNFVLNTRALVETSGRGILLVLCLLVVGCGSDSGSSASELEGLSWSEIEARAEGQTLNVAMWMGDPSINDYMRSYVADTLQARYGIDLNVSSAQGNEVVSMLMTEKEAGVARSQFDVMWINGETFYQLYANGEVHFTMTNNDGEVDNKVAEGLFPEPSQGFVPAFGSIQNSHYLGVARRAPHKAAALVAINFLISPAAQLRKLRPEVWGDGTVLDRAALPGRWQERFATVADRDHAPPRTEMQDRALAEPDPEYMLRLEDDFREKIIRGE